jgi:hypothetical protein
MAARHRRRVIVDPGVLARGPAAAVGVAFTD